MPKKIKLNLNDLKVQSFVTAFDDKEKREFIGGTSDDGGVCPPTCGSQCATVCSLCFTQCTGSPICEAC